jgi:peptidylprolyl isomerase
MNLTPFATPLVISLAMAGTGCGTPAGNTDGAIETGADAVAQDTPAGDTPAGDSGPSDCALPAGYTLTPFVTTDPVRMFAMVGMATMPGRDYVAVIETDVGRLVLDLYEDQTPITVNSFIWLARNHYYDGIAFHRVINGFVAQGGDPNTLSDVRSSWGSGGPGYTFGLEIVPSLTYDRAGVVGMARTMDPNSNGSQFYITLGPTPNLNGQYTIFARVTEGLEVLPMIARGQPPTTPTRMQRVCIAERTR